MCIQRSYYCKNNIEIYNNINIIQNFIDLDLEIYNYVDCYM